MATNQQAEPTAPATPTSPAVRHSRTTAETCPGSRRRSHAPISAVCATVTQASVKAACIRNPSPPSDSDAAR